MRAWSLDPSHIPEPDVELDGVTLITNATDPMTSHSDLQPDQFTQLFLDYKDQDVLLAALTIFINESRHAFNELPRRAIDAVTLEYIGNAPINHRSHRLMPSQNNTIKVCVSDEMLTQLNAQAELEGMPRSEYIRRTMAGELHPLVLENYPKTCADVLRATNGKLSRAEVDHVVSVVIKGMASS